MGDDFFIGFGNSSSSNFTTAHNSLYYHYLTNTNYAVYTPPPDVQKTPDVQKKSSNLQWLDDRIEEYRVHL